MPNYFKIGQGNQWLRSARATCDFRISDGTVNSAHCTSPLRFPGLSHSRKKTVAEESFDVNKTTIKIFRNKKPVTNVLFVIEEA